MFKSEAQICRINRILSKAIQREEWWTEAGPSEVAKRYVDHDGGPLSSGERRMLLFTFQLWNVHVPNRLKVHELLELDSNLTYMIGDLIANYASGTLDLWIENYEKKGATK